MARAVGRRSAWLVGLALLSGGCAFGPRGLHANRIRYNDAVKTSSE